MAALSSEQWVKLTPAYRGDPTVLVQADTCLFSRLCDAHYWVLSRPNIRMMWDVAVPSGEALSVFKRHASAAGVTLSNPRPIPTEVWARAIQLDSEALRMMPHDLVTPQLLVQVVNHNVWAFLTFAEKSKTVEMSLAAVRQDGRLLSFVPHEMRTREVCFAVVMNDGQVLNDVPAHLQSYCLCLAAVQQNGRAFTDVPRKHQDQSMLSAAMRPHDRPTHTFCPPPNFSLPSQRPTTVSPPPLPPMVAQSPSPRPTPQPTTVSPPHLPPTVTLSVPMSPSPRPTPQPQGATAMKSSCCCVLM